MVNTLNSHSASLNPGAQSCTCINGQPAVCRCPVALWGLSACLAQEHNAMTLPSAWTWTTQSRVQHAITINRPYTSPTNIIYCRWVNCLPTSLTTCLKSSSKKPYALAGFSSRVNRLPPEHSSITMISFWDLSCEKDSHTLLVPRVYKQQSYSSIA